MGMEDTVWDTLLWDTLVSDTLDSDTDMASVRLRLSPRLMLRPVLIPTTWEDTEDTGDTEDTAWDTLLWDTLVSDTEVCTEDTVYTDTDSASRISSRRTIGRIVGE